MTAAVRSSAPARISVSRRSGSFCTQLAYPSGLTRPNSVLISSYSARAAVNRRCARCASACRLTQK